MICHKFSPEIVRYSGGRAEIFSSHADNIVTRIEGSFDLFSLLAALHCENVANHMTKAQTRKKRKEYAQRQREARRKAGLVDMPGYFASTTADEVRRLAKLRQVSIQRVIPALVEMSLAFLGKEPFDQSSILRFCASFEKS